MTSLRVGVGAYIGGAYITVPLSIEVCCFELRAFTCTQNVLFLCHN
jgi:hypothetical protein